MAEVKDGFDEGIAKAVEAEMKESNQWSEENSAGMEESDARSEAFEAARSAERMEDTINGLKSDAESSENQAKNEEQAANDAADREMEMAIALIKDGNPGGGGGGGGDDGDGGDEQ